LALGGDDLTYNTGTITTPTTTGNSLILVDVEPQTLLLAISTATGTTAHSDSGANGVALGMADDTTEYSHTAYLEDAAGTTNTGSVATTTDVLDLDSSSGSARTDVCTASATFVASSFILNYTTVDASSRKGWWVVFGVSAGTEHTADSIIYGNIKIIPSSSSEHPANSVTTSRVLITPRSSRQIPASSYLECESILGVASSVFANPIAIMQGKILLGGQSSLLASGNSSIENRALLYGVSSISVLAVTDIYNKILLQATVQGGQLHSVSTILYLDGILLGSGGLIFPGNSSFTVKADIVSRAGLMYSDSAFIFAEALLEIYGGLTYRASTSMLAQARLSALSSILSSGGVNINILALLEAIGDVDTNEVRLVYELVHYLLRTKTGTSCYANRIRTQNFNMQ